MLKLRHQVHTRTVGSRTTSVLAGGNHDRGRGVASRPHKVEAMDLNSFSGMSNPQQFSTVGNSGQQYDMMMSGIVSDDDQANTRFYRDIYRYDNTAGSAVDLLSLLPFSSYQLVGTDKDRQKAYESSTERLNLKTALMPMSIEYLVTGKFIGTLLFRADQKIFTELMPHKIEDATITPAPFFGVEPSIEVRQSAVVSKFLESKDPRFQRMLRGLNPSFRRALESQAMLLDSSTTLYIPRMAEASNPLGMSLYKRILPLYLIEKALYRGTLIEAQRRQRSLLHVKAGDEEWEPTSEELQAVVSLFQQADLDPLGAIIATRNGVDASELRAGGDFWKYTDMTDLLSPMKLRALGISETFLNGDANYSSMEVSLSVFLDMINNHRETFTQEVFYNKVFPIIAVTNGFYKKDTPQQVKSSIQDQLRMQYNIADVSMLDIPQVQYVKQLKPTANKDYIEVLTTMEEKGLPIGLRMWAAAGGLDAESIVTQAEEEKELKARIDKLGVKKKDNEEYARVKKTFAVRSDYPEDVTEIRAKTKTGAAKYIPNQKAATQKMHALAAKALHRLAHTYTPRSSK